jgi:hypothetical protein
MTEGEDEGGAAMEHEDGTAHRIVAREAMRDTSAAVFVMTAAVGCTTRVVTSP